MRKTSHLPLLPVGSPTVGLLLSASDTRQTIPGVT